MKRRTIATSCCAAALLLALAEPALAAGSGGAVGQNIGELLRTWAQSLFGGVVALVSILFLVNRRYNDLALFVCASLIVGGMVFSTSSVAKVIRSIWTTVAA